MAKKKVKRPLRREGVPTVGEQVMSEASLIKRKLETIADDIDYSYLIGLTRSKRTLKDVARDLRTTGADILSDLAKIVSDHEEDE